MSPRRVTTPAAAPKDRLVYVVRPIHLMLGTILWWLFYLALLSDAHVAAAVTNTVGFSFLILVPGTLTMMTLPLKKLVPWGKLALAVGFSVLELMLVGLILNTVLQWAGVARPLDSQYLIVGISLLLAVLLPLMWRRNRKWKLKVGQKAAQLFPTARDRIMTSVPLLFVALSVFGATALNNGGADAWTVIMLVGMGGYALYLILISKQLSDNTVATALFLMALSLLLMTSLRGWFVTGHDIQREYAVFQLTKNSGVWQIQHFRDPYNACLSITILPTMFFNLLHTADAYVYKIFFQLLFALTPPVLYLLVRKWASVAFAFAATLYFIAFPTFFTDMPMLNRQETALVFFALMLFIIFQDGLTLRLRRGIFLALGTGLILSHYSTTYSVIVIMLAAVVMWPVIVRLGKRLRRKPAFRQTSWLAINGRRREAQRVTMLMTVAIIAGSFLWTTVLTNTGNNTARVIKSTAEAALHSFKEEGPKASETDYNLFSFQSVDPQQRLDSYVGSVVTADRRQHPAAYYPAGTYADYQPKVIPTAVLPLTRLGRAMQRVGIDVAGFNTNFRQGWAKILQLLILIGFIYLMLRGGYTRSLDTDYLALAIGCIAFVALQVVLPVLSVEYGLLRAFQQSLMLLGIFVVLGSLVLCIPLRNRRLKVIVPTVLAVVFLLSSTGVFTQLLGAYQAQLHLNNSGLYYDVYYQHKSDVLGIDWLNSTIKTAARVAERHGTTPPSDDIQTSATSQIFATNDLYPGLIRRDAYVLLGYSNIHKQQATVFYQGDTVVYRYPLRFLDDTKNLIYDNGSARVYR